jgi:hypothetical protein
MARQSVAPLSKSRGCSMSERPRAKLSLNYNYRPTVVTPAQGATAGGYLHLGTAIRRRRGREGSTTAAGHHTIILYTPPGYWYKDKKGSKRHQGHRRTHGEAGGDTRHQGDRRAHGGLKSPETPGDRREHGGIAAGCSRKGR